LKDARASAREGHWSRRKVEERAKEEDGGDVGAEAVKG